MAGDTYDIIPMGDGLGGASFTTAIAEYGTRLLVLESGQQFKDRVRDEILAP